MPNNNSSIQCTALGDGAMALTFNNTSRADATERRVSLYDEIDDEGISDGSVQRGIGERDADGSEAFWGAPRAPLTLGLSVDDGRSWPVLWDLATGDGYCMTNNSRDGLNRELSYPSVTPGADGDLHVTFTHHRRAIRYVHVPADRLAEGLDEAGRGDGG